MLVELAEDGRALDVPAQPGRARRLERHGAHDPGHAQGDACGQRGPEQPIDGLQPGYAHRARARAPSPSSPLAMTPPASSAPSRPNSGA